MDSLTPAKTPDATGVLRQVGSLVAPWRWPIGIACLLVAGLALALFRSGPGAPVWTGTTIVKIGVAPGVEYLTGYDDTPALAPIESKRSLVERISAPAFRTKIIADAKFEPATAALSRELAASTLRAVGLEGEHNVSVEVSAASNADVTAVFSSLASEISSIHDVLGQQRIDTQRGNIADMQHRADFLERAIIDPALPTPGLPGKEHDETTSPSSPRNMTAAIKIWNTLRNPIQRDTNMLKFTEKTAIDTEPGTFPRTQRSIEPVKNAILAGLAMLGVMIILIVAIGRPRLHVK